MSLQLLRLAHGGFTDQAWSPSQPRIITADTQIGGRQVPAALNVPFGNLFFGFELRPPPGSAEEAAAQAEAAEASNPTVVPFAGVGSGNTLSGRARSGASLPSGAPTPPRATASPAPTEVKPSVPFSGSGNTLSGKKPIETIEID